MAIDISKVALYLATLEGILSLLAKGVSPAEAIAQSGVGAELGVPDASRIIANITSLITDIHGKAPEAIAVDVATLVKTLEEDKILPASSFEADAVAAVETFEATKADFLTGQFAVVGHAEIYGLEAVIGVVAKTGPAASALGI